MVALNDWRSNLCPGCGQPIEECRIPDDVPDSQLPLVSAKRYEAGYNRCIGCFRLEYEQKALQDMHKGMKEQPPSGHLKWYVKKL